MDKTSIPSSNFDISPNRVDWNSIAQDLKQAGLSYSMQADLIGHGWSTMQRWLAGAEPKHSDGVAWLQLHANVCGENQTHLRLGTTQNSV